uniref:hypothetical protein n=1 Tax=uncultured Allobacillus sp. TaxID=1638025 RepID=UPI0025952B30|nr:hypothetical protein [uncultured Allobacillus sp.]
MSIINSKEHIKHIVRMIDFFQNGKGIINKENNDSDYQNGIYTPEDILGQIKYNAEQALNELNK